MKITERQWKLINDITLRIHSIDDVTEMRKDFLSVCNALLHFDAASFYVQEGENPYGSPLGVNLTDEDFNRYIEYYSHIDPFAPLMKMFADSQDVIRTSDYVPMSEVDDTDYYKNVMAPKKVKYSLIMPMVINGEWLGCLTLFRRSDKNDFSEQDMEIAAVLKKHIQVRLWRENRFAGMMVQEENLPEYSEFNGKMADKYGLTERECEVIRMIVKSFTDDEISDAMSISKNTLKKHIGNIYNKMNINSRVALMKVVSKNRLQE